MIDDCSYLPTAYRLLPTDYGFLSGDLIKYAIIAVVAAVALYVLLKILRRRRREVSPRVADLAIDVASLPGEGPPAGPPILEHYNVPVRLWAIVLAPTGRVSELPSLDKIPELIDHVVPGLGQVVAAQKPLIRRWPPQLSGEGFARSFFTHVKLPGDAGKGTPWCSVAGRFKIGRESFMAGLLMRAESGNNFSQSIIKEEHQWLGILRVKSS